MRWSAWWRFVPWCTTANTKCPLYYFRPCPSNIVIRYCSTVLTYLMTWWMSENNWFSSSWATLFSTDATTAAYKHHVFFSTHVEQIASELWREIQTKSLYTKTNATYHNAQQEVCKHSQNHYFTLKNNSILKWSRNSTQALKTLLMVPETENVSWVFSLLLFGSNLNFPLGSVWFHTCKISSESKRIRKCHVGIFIPFTGQKSHQPNPLPSSASC